MFVVQEGKRLVNAGDQFGLYMVLGAAFYMPVGTLKKMRQFVVCQCRCGAKQIACVPDLRNGKLTSCGCTGKARIAEIGRQSATHGMTDTRLYRSWSAMKMRCVNPHVKAYPNYGGRGITVCDEWLDFQPFMEWALANGYRDDLEIDRIDVNGNYEPGNCRWATVLVQMNNRRNTVTFEAYGETKAVADWSRDPRCKVSYEAIYDRIRRGWNPEVALTRPERKIKQVS